MMSMRSRVASPALSQRSAMSTPLSWRVDGSPYFDLCPPTPQWNSSPSIGMIAQSHNIADNATEFQIARTAYQGCSRRMDSACAANRSQSIEEQRLWWEETLSLCRNAIRLHNITLSKQYNHETAKNLELLEHALYAVQTMLDSLTSRQELPAQAFFTPRSLSYSTSTSSTLVGDEPEPVKRSKRLGFSTIFGKVMDHLTAKEPHMETLKMGRPDSMLY